MTKKNVTINLNSEDPAHKRVLEWLGAEKEKLKKLLEFDVTDAQLLAQCLNIPTPKIIKQARLNIVNKMPTEKKVKILHKVFNETHNSDVKLSDFLYSNLRSIDSKKESKMIGEYLS